MTRKRVCSIEGCERGPVKARGMCGMHYQRWRVSEGRLEARPGDPLCSVPQCTARAAESGASRGYCPKHYLRLKRHGNPLAGGVTPGFRDEWIRGHAGYLGDDCLYPPFDPGRRAYVNINRKCIPASRYMCIQAHGEPADPNLFACHTCGNGGSGCVNPKHLYWGTPSDNQMDRVQEGTANRGSRHGMSKLTESEVREIRLAARNGEIHRTIAERYGVSRRTVGHIVRGSTWSWLGNGAEKEAA